MSQIIFICLSLMMVVSAFFVILSRNPIYSILSLILCFFGISGHYLLLNAPFLAVVQIIVYAGAIMVLFLFTLMLMNLNHLSAFFRSQKWVVFASLIGGLFAVILTALAMSFGRVSVAVPGIEGTAKVLGYRLFTEFWVPFELSTLLFLASVVAVVMIGKSLQAGDGGSR